MNEAMNREMSEEATATKLANYVLDHEVDPDSDIALLSRQFLRKMETVRSLVQAVGGHIFVPSGSIQKANDPSLKLTVSFDDKEHGYHVRLVSF